MAFQPLSDKSNVMTTTLQSAELSEKGKEREAAHNTIPPSILLLSLPSIVAHPPDHPQYVNSLHVSLDAIRKCLRMHSSEGGCWSLSLEHECRAHGMLAEIGLAIMHAGLHRESSTPWAKAIETEIDHGITQGTRLCQQIPALRIHKPHFTLLRANLLLCQKQLRTCRVLLRREINNLTKSHPPSIHYTCYLTSLSAHLSSTANQPQDVASALQILNRLQSLAETNADKEVATLARVTRFQVLIRAELSSQLDDACQDAEAALGLSFEIDRDPSSKDGQEPLVPGPSTSDDEDSPLMKSLKIHTLMLSVLHHAQAKSFKMATARIGALHSILDADALTTFPEGLINVPLASGPSLELTTTHPRILYEMAFLVSSVSKRDVLGRRPRRKVFACEGIAISKEVNKLVPFPFNANLDDVQHVHMTLARLRADVLCELVSICTMRSEFDEAIDHFDELVAHTRNNELFDEFASRITLLTAHMAHARATGLGAPLEKNGDQSAADNLGNLPLGLWVGERFLEVYKRTGRDDKAKKQEGINLRLQEALNEIRTNDSKTFEADSGMDIEDTKHTEDGMDIDS
ncbi:hypothetical protein FRC02_001415 [Tulasnella sp. 418]|nr:hypothetical protein FRC02_001415 [Tulasnella sp. 418]